ncbi:FMN-binding protein [Anaerobranca gottschalkii]|uniref:Electron transport complex, RnfABCDGE type, G subunit n=1 Tax=Anaerobranca gottschalkii DSM 13577 TaxID=1120990 RepID=A0A1H9Y9L0_9FIRM|nr:FMN-binding protein [Anaerobranca gottschalkii]SES65629.1 electron transport complex, RnfABCDGE type, G subunit [Anaerobranca gottschalkii DSM 13577]
MNNIFRLIITLTLIAAIATGLLAVVNNITSPIIEEGARQRLAQALGRVIDADDFEEIDENGIKYFKGYKNGEHVGYVIRVESKGYGSSPIVMIVGLTTDVVVTGVEVLSHSETPGLGDRPFAPNKLAEFIGQGLESGINFDVVSGATSSSLGALAGVNEAVTILGRLLGLIAEIDFALVPDGTYKGAGRGFGGDIEVEVTIKDGKLVDIKILSHNETPGISDPAFEKTPKNIIEQQTLEVDTVSGATATCNGIKAAVRNALAQFFGGDQEEPEDPIILSEVANGKYVGVGQGLFGEVKVEVVVNNGKIVSLTVEASEDTADYVAIAVEKMTERLLEATDLEQVDVKTGATKTSEGILEAVKNALRGEPVIDLKEIPNGTYRGEAEGFFGPVKVEVTIKNGVIVEINYISTADETKEYADIARKAMKERLEGSDTLDVDVKTGATGTSKGILNAVKNALTSGLQ